MKWGEELTAKDWLFRELNEEHFFQNMKILDVGNCKLSIKVKDKIYCNRVRKYLLKTYYPDVIMRIAVRGDIIQIWIRK
jgi:hypothetical protein